jgi:hypothetical protein
LLREGKLDAENVISLRKSPVRQRTLRAPFGARSTRRKLSLSGKRPYALRERPARPARLARPLRHTQARPAPFLQGLPACAPFSARPLACSRSLQCSPARRTISSAYASAPCALPPGFACSRSLQCSPARRTIGSRLERGSECWGGSRCPDLAKGRHTAARISLSPKARWKPWKH